MPDSKHKTLGRIGGTTGAQLESLNPQPFSRTRIRIAQPSLHRRRTETSRQTDPCDSVSWTQGQHRNAASPPAPQLHPKHASRPRPSSSTRNPYASEMQSIHNTKPINKQHTTPHALVTNVNKSTAVNTNKETERKKRAKTNANSAPG